MAKRSIELKCGCAHCFYCDAPLTRRHEHDHFPVPTRHGGGDTVPCCLNCHDLKDRVDFAHWPPAATWELFNQVMLKAPPMVRVYLAQMHAEMLDLYQRLEEGS